MHARFEPIPPTEPLAASPMLAERAPGDATTRFFVALLGFFCFLPYPAFTVGNRSALQLGNILSLVMCFPLLAVSWRKKSYHLTLLLLAPVCISALKVAVTGEGDLALSLKSIPLRGMTWLSLLATQYYAPIYALELLMGIATATLLHVAVGLYQLYCFSNNDFPFPELYVNVSFLSVQDFAKTIASYIQRPFGIFPEPSAMSSSLAPWIVIWLAELSGLLRLKGRQPTRWQKTVFASAAVGALLLIILSRSGHTFVTLFAIAILAAMWLTRCRANLRNYLVILCVCCVVLPVIFYFGAEAMSDRLGGKSDVGNSSWDERSTSLKVGYQMLVNNGLATLIFGIGPSLCAPAMFGALRLEAVWSVLLNYVYETGAIGFVAVLWVTLHMVRVWKQSRFNVVFFAIASVWFVGILLTTSYEQLLPLWIVMAWLVEWQEIYEPATRIANANASPQRAVVGHLPAAARAPALAPLPVMNWQMPDRGARPPTRRLWGEP